MNCPNCGLEYTGPVCPACGAAQESAEIISPIPDAPASVQEEAAPEMPPEALLESATDEREPEASDETESEVEAPAEDSGETEDTSETEGADKGASEMEDAALPETAPKKKRNTAAIVLGAVAGLMLIVVVCLAVVITSLSKTGEMPPVIASLQQSLQKSSYHGDRIALQVTDEDGALISEINNRQLSLYYWGEFFYYVNQYGISFDLSQPLDAQAYSEDMTWQDYFLEGAKTSIQQIEALKAAAAKDGFIMPEDYQSEYDSVVEALPDHAASAGFTDADGNGDVLAYIQDSYGEAVTEEDFQQYLYDSYFASAYTEAVYEDFQNRSKDELEAFYDEHAEEMALYGIEKTDLPNVEVRHILIQPETLAEDATEEDENLAREDALTEAQRIYELWKSGEATEDSFAALAEEYTQDPGSASTGGLYEDVYPGQMVTAFNDWCFDESRQPGDTDIVETDYGYHIMYFVRFTDTYEWMAGAAYVAYTEYLDALAAACTVTATKDLALITPDAVEEILASQTAS